MLTEYFDLAKRIHDYFGYKEDWAVIPLADYRNEHWFVTGEGPGAEYCHSPEPFTEESVRAGKVIYGGHLYTQRFLPKWVHRGEEYTMVCMDTRTDGNKLLGVFSNDKECKDQSLISLYKECW